MAVERVREFTAKAPDNAQGFYLASRAYAATGDLLMYSLALVGVITWWRAARPLVASDPETDEEE